ncbi:hypothetical protein TNCV_1580261 [Trichonephila clavipes]|nr:hypothetical protein TNCV_1580261 [Trichonephila clavipes]
MTLNSYKPSGVINAVFSTIRFDLFLFANNQIGDPWKKEHGTFQTVERIIVNTRQRINVFRDAIQLAIIDAKTHQLPSFFTSTMGDDQGLSEGWTIPSSKHFLNLFMNDASFSRRDSRLVG